MGTRSFNSQTEIGRGKEFLRALSDISADGWQGGKNNHIAKYNGSRTIRFIFLVWYDMYIVRVMFQKWVHVRFKHNFIYTHKTQIVSYSIFAILCAMSNIYIKVCSFTYRILLFRMMWIDKLYRSTVKLLCIRIYNLKFRRKRYFCISDRVHFCNFLRSYVLGHRLVKFTDNRSISGYFNFLSCYVLCNALCTS